MWLSIEPMDVLLFRGSRPFTAGEVIRAASQFPPTPLTMAGALRGAMFSHLGLDHTWCEGHDRLGGPRDLGPLRFRGPFLVGRNSSGGQETLLPPPRDILVGKGDRGEMYPDYLQPEAPTWPGLALSPPSLPYQLVSRIPGVTSPDNEDQPVHLRGNRLLDYLRRRPEPDILWKTEIAIPEPRLGIRLTPQRTAETGQIYLVEFTRLEPGAALLVEVNSSVEDAAGLLPGEGFLPLGGEARAAYFRRLAPKDEPEPFASAHTQQQALVQALAGQKRFRLYLLTPALFQAGWLPDDVAPTDHTWRLGGLTGALVAAAVGKAEPVGGWNLATQAPRRLRRAVPAGSVYFFELEEALDEAGAKALVEAYHLKSLMRHYGFQAAAGFGLAALGIW